MPERIVRRASGAGSPARAAAPANAVATARGGSRPTAASWPRLNAARLRVLLRVPGRAVATRLAGRVLAGHEADTEKDLHIALDEYLERLLQSNCGTEQLDGFAFVDPEELKVTHTPPPGTNSAHDEDLQPVPQATNLVSGYRGPDGVSPVPERSMPERTVDAWVASAICTVFPAARIWDPTQAMKGRN